MNPNVRLANFDTSHRNAFPVRRESRVVDLVLRLADRSQRISLAVPPDQALQSGPSRSFQINQRSIPCNAGMVAVFSDGKRVAGCFHRVNGERYGPEARGVIAQVDDVAAVIVDRPASRCQGLAPPGSAIEGDDLSISSRPKFHIE